MEALKSKLDNDSYQKLNVHKFTDDSLQYVTDAELVKIGITEMGPRLVILSNVAKKKCTSPNASDSTPLAEISQNQLDIRMTQSSPVSGPSKTSKALNEAHTDGRSVPSSTRSEHEPQSVRQTLEEAAKFRKTLYSKLDAGVVPNHRELLHMVRILCAGMVNDLMKNQKYPTFDQKMTLAQKIIETFPILKVTKLSDESPDYIQKAYERLMPTYNKESNLKQLFARGLLNESGSFSSFQDAHCRGCLRILLRLTRRGVRKTLQSIDPDSVDIEAELAAPVIQLIENTEASLQQQLMKYVATNVHTDKEVAPHLIFNGNMYLMYIQTQVIICGTDSINALDTLFKSFTVFRLPPPATLQKILDFIEIMCYQTKRNSSRQTVNNLAKSFRDSLDAEASDSD